MINSLNFLGRHQHINSHRNAKNKNLSFLYPEKKAHQSKDSTFIKEKLRLYQKNQRCNSRYVRYERKRNYDFKKETSLII